ncbi:hypothetical protein ACA910_002654 [Epithemia clementina (nom. ined.)]
MSEPGKTKKEEDDDEASRALTTEIVKPECGLNDEAGPNEATTTGQKNVVTPNTGGDKEYTDKVATEVVAAHDEEEEEAVPKRPVKRARTAFFIFADERRPEVQKQHAGTGVAAVGRALGQLWATLSDEEKQVYQKQAAAERERVAKDLEAWNKAHGNKPSTEQVFQQKSCAAGSSRDPQQQHSSMMGYPSARVRKICKLDPEVRGLSKEALLLVTKAAELATIKLGLESVRVAQIQNRRKLLPEDVAMVCRTRDQFAFLKQDVLDLVREQQQQQQQQHADGKKNSKTKSQPISSNPITAYFAPKETTKH